MVQMEQKYQSTAGIFKNPPNEFRMMPFWFWNHEMVEKEVQRQIRDHNDHGIGGEFIHPRHGRLTPYMGRRWLENVEAAADQCKERDMPCFLYDEDNWPSGPAGGYITGPYRPENRGKMIGMVDENVFEGPGHEEYELDIYAISEESEIYAAIAIPNPSNYPDLTDVIDKQIDVTKFVKGNLFSWDVPEGEWTVVFFALFTTPYRQHLNGYIDILRKETVKDFIDFTHKRYVDWFIDHGKKDYLGTVVPGIFTDEPSMGQCLSGPYAMFKRVIFTPTMPQKFKEMFGYEFNEVILSLFYDTGAISAKHRCDYWECTTQLYVDAFYKQIYEYCDIYNLRTTGHINSEGSFPSQVSQHGDFFKVFQYMHYGGCDQLTEDVRPDGIEELWSLKASPYTGMANEMILTSKFASSAAHLLGKPRVLVEAWGTSSWDITMASAKRVNDYLIATGCDLFVPHSFNYSEDGYRKADHPEAFNYQPYYTHWKKFADYNGRLCAIFNAHSGVLVPEVLLFYATKSFHAEMMPHNSVTADMLGKFFVHHGDCLFRQQLDFELANEDMILGSTLGKGTFTIRNETFKMLFLGMTTCLSLKFAQWIETYYNAGGKILATCMLPTKDANKGDSAEIAQIMQRIFGVNPSEMNTFALKANDSAIKTIENQNAAGGRAIFIKCAMKDPVTMAYYPEIEAACRNLIPIPQRDLVVYRDFKAGKHAAYISTKHKVIDGKDFYFLANTSRTANYSAAKVLFNRIPQKMEFWDAITGEIKETTAYGIESGKTSVLLDFPPYQSYTVVITPAPENAEKPAPKVVEYSTCNGNSAPLQTIDLGSDWRLVSHGINGAMLFKNWHATFEQEAGKAWGYTGRRTFTHHFKVYDLAAITPVRLVIEGLVGDYGWGKYTQDPLIGGDRAHFTFPNYVNISVNGKPVAIKFDFTPEFMDPCWIVSDISNLLQEGDNVVEFVCTTHNEQTFHVVSDPWRLVGNFAVDESSENPTLSKPGEKISLGDFTLQGLTRYHGGVGYKTSVTVPAEAEGKKICLNIADTTDCIEVLVNGTNCGVLWNQWNLEIGSALKPGQKNEIELIYYGIAQNMLQTNLKPQGIRGKVTLSIFP
jgi:hypothetical protein